MLRGFASLIGERVGGASRGEAAAFAPSAKRSIGVVTTLPSSSCEMMKSERRSASSASRPSRRSPSLSLEPETSPFSTLAVLSCEAESSQTKDSSAPTRDAMSTGSVARSLARSLRSDASTSTTTLNRLSRVAAPSPRSATRSPLANPTTATTCTCAHLHPRHYSSYPTQPPGQCWPLAAPRTKVARSR